MGTNANPFAAPFRVAHAILQRIPDPRVRRAASFILAFAVSLAVGRAFEVVLSDEQVIAAEKAQKQWIETLASFAPLSLVKGYAADFRAVMAGDLVYVAPEPPPTLTDEAQAEINAGAAAIAACNLARFAPEPSAACADVFASGLSSSDCLVHPENPGCAALNACAEERDTLFKTPPECVGVGDGALYNYLGVSRLNGDLASPLTVAPTESASVSVPIYFAPIAATFRSVTRIIGENKVAPFIAIGQVAIGALAFLVITHIGSNGARLGFDDALGNLLFAPACIVFLASLSALIIQWLMIGALGAFSWATSLAAACCGTSSVGAALWYCLKKLGEKGVEGALTSGR